jgi:RNA polymerase sigma-70 factor (ECF subfamily)
VLDDLLSLVDRCLAGEQPAMGELVRRFQGQVFGLCFRMLGNRQDAEDMAQESFARALRSLHRWDSTRNFEPWLLAIAGNRCRTLMSTRRRRPETSSLVMDVASREGDEHAARSLSEEVAQGLLAVRQEYRQAFLMFHQHEMSYLEIADALDCPLGTVKTWIYRARRELIEHLRSRGVVEGRVVEETGNALRSI